MSDEKQCIQPIIKWAGGKTKILTQFTGILADQKYDRFIDLFCGSLVIPLHLNVRNGIFNDINTGLINMYKIVKNRVEELLVALEELNHANYNNKDSFNELRAEFNQLKAEEELEQGLTAEQQLRFAALFLYLNRRSFNGLYRENISGQYNVPFRSYKSAIYKESRIRNLSEYFNANNIKFISKNFNQFSLRTFKTTDIVYIDPPYYPSKKSSFTSYWKTPFGVKEQEKLALFCRKLDEKGVRFILSNSPCIQVEELYEGFNQKKFYIGRQMRDANGNSAVFSAENEPNEILIWNFSNIHFED